MDIYLPLANKYYKWYLSICVARNYRIKQKGLIRHHIDPKSFYVKYAKDGWKTTNPDIKTNIVYLTEREHFIVHWLLCYCYKSKPKQKMCRAFNKMCNKNKSSKYYEISQTLNKRTGENNPNFKKVIELVCNNCQQIFCVKPRYKKRKYCSLQCHYEHTGENNPMFGRSGKLSPVFGTKGFWLGHKGKVKHR